jgi:type II secretory pathway pseudopilin PulG
MKKTKTSCKKAAFTLAETLIAIGIIGVVAAMTIPTIMSKCLKRQVEAQAKETYSSLMQAMRASVDDGVGANFTKEISHLSMNDWVDAYISPKMKIVQRCSISVGGCWHKSGVVKTLTNETPRYERNLGNNWAAIGHDAYSFRTAKGAYFDMDYSSAYLSKKECGVTGISGVNTFQIYIDVNGDRGPNVIGKDIYIMVWVSDEKFVPAGYDMSASEVENNCTKGDGYWCLSYLMRNNWVISDAVWKRKQ